MTSYDDYNPKRDNYNPHIWSVAHSTNQKFIGSWSRKMKLLFEGLNSVIKTINYPNNRSSFTEIPGRNTLTRDHNCLACEFSLLGVCRWAFQTGMRRGFLSSDPALSTSEDRGRAWQISAALFQNHYSLEGALLKNSTHDIKLYNGQQTSTICLAHDIEEFKTINKRQVDNSSIKENLFSQLGD